MLKNLQFNLTIGNGSSLDLFAEVLTSGGVSTGCTPLADKLTFTKLNDTAPSLVQESNTSGDLAFQFSP